MSEELWQTATRPRILCQLLQATTNSAKTNVGRRKLRLAGIACCRRAWALFARDRLKQAVETAEQFANKEITKAQATAAAKRVWWASWVWPPAERRVALAARAVLVNQIWTAALAGEYLAHRALASRRGTTTSEEFALQSELFRCIFSSPFRSTAFEPCWRTSNTVALAKAIHATHAFDRLPILADALEEAGCDSADTLDHCRRPQVHARGCWVVDAVLGHN